MPSANGHKIEVTRSNGETYTLTASWPAPFYVLVDAGEGPPLLYHAQNRADARAFAGIGGGHITLLDAEFLPIHEGTRQ